MHIGNAILCIADRGWFSLSKGQQVFPPINLLSLKILLPDVFNFLAVLFSTAFFFERGQRAPSAIVTLLFLGCFYAGFQYLAWAMQNLRKSAKSKPAA